MGDLILFGLPPTIDATRQRLLSRSFGELLTAKMKKPVEVVVAASYSELTDELAEGRYDYAWLPPLEAYTIARECAVELLVQTARGAGNFYYSVLYTLHDSPLRDVAGLRGKKVAYVHRRSTSGYLAPAVMLLEKGITLAKPLLFAGSHARAVEMVRSGKAHAGATHASFEGPPEKGRVTVAGWSTVPGLKEKDIRIIGFAGPIPSATVCAWPGTTQGDRSAMSRVLLGLHRTKAGAALVSELFDATNFVAPTDDGYDFIEHALQRLTQRG